MRLFLVGLAGGMGLMLLVHLVQRAGGWVVVGPGERAGGRVGWTNLAILVAVSALEEWLFRGWLFDLLLPRVGATGTLVVTSAVFGLLHLGNRVRPLTIFNAALAGAAFGAARLLTGGLGLAVGLHVGWNVMQWPVLGYPLYGLERRSLFHFPTLITCQPRGPRLLSGGADGPEGSLLDTAAFGLLLLFLARLAG
ncbi:MULTISPECIES: CPBP family intramembrane glutamic endopeptidase [Limnochorda]|uniref:CPBP family intramembrane glutamic endopeptidase n=1 Tax=Limnochorda TaxID=1676651 RepID=UPI0017D3D551|nr:CPBP family intramembrane glutamic endopeptidase [Limnochorda pilosa]MBO2487296.1 hypothetical protein [Bacillota bacterium]NMA71427.1 CPBP family intramembrane metalloprotease [Bacillota bacterium]